MIDVWTDNYNLLCIFVSPFILLKKETFWIKVFCFYQVSGTSMKYIVLK